MLKYLIQILDPKIEEREDIDAVHGHSCHRGVRSIRCHLKGVKIDVKSEQVEGSGGGKIGQDTVCSPQSSETSEASGGAHRDLGQIKLNGRKGGHGRRSVTGGCEVPVAQCTGGVVAEAPNFPITTERAREAVGGHDHGQGDRIAEGDVPLQGERWSSHIADVRRAADAGSS